MSDRPHDDHCHVVWGNGGRERAAQCVYADECVGERLVDAVAGSIAEAQVAFERELHANRRASRLNTDVIVNHKRIRVLRVQLPLPHLNRVTLCAQVDMRSFEYVYSCIWILSINQYIY